jgi:hypothetical protein
MLAVSTFVSNSVDGMVLVVDEFKWGLKANYCGYEPAIADIHYENIFIALIFA